MKMEDRLPGSNIFVEANVEAVRAQLFRDHGLTLINCQPDRCLFGRAKVRPSGGMTPGDDEKMTLSYRKSIPNCDY
jgi:hypothetical protein